LITTTRIKTRSQRTYVAIEEPFRDQQEQQRVAVVDPKTRISFPFARCRPTQPRCSAADAGIVVWRAGGAAAVAAVYRQIDD